MKKKLFFIGLFIIFLIGVNLLNRNSEVKFGLLMTNIEALAASNESEGNTCPNGGQKTRGEAKNKQWKETYTTNSEGKVEVHGQTLDFGYSKKNQSVSFYCYSVECPGRTGDCFLCNTWCK